MFANQAEVCNAVGLLGAGTKANTAAATGAGVDVKEYEGDLMVTQLVGLITAGTLDGKLQACSDAGGTGAEDIAGAVFAQVDTTNDDPNVQKIAVPISKIPNGKPFVRYVGTIVTGPALLGVVMHATKKYNP